MQLIDRSIRWLAYIYLLRFPILTAAAAVGLVIAAFTFARPLLGNLFDVNLPYAQVWLAFTVFATAWVIMVAARLVVLYGPARFQLEPYIEPYRIGPDLRWWHIVLFGTAIALPVVAGAIYYTYRHNESISLARLIVEAAIGCLLSLALLFLLGYVQKRLTVPDRAVPPSPAFPDRTPDIFFPTDARAKREALEHPRERVLIQRIAERIMRLLRNVPEKFGGGYFEYKDGKAQSVLPGQGAAAVLFVAILAIYAGVGIFAYKKLDQPSSLPTLSYVMLLLMLFCWGMSGLAFFLDRFRVPVLIPLFAWLVVTSSVPWSDFYYKAIDATQVPRANQQAAIARYAGDAIVVVAASGGGIQAAAWTAQVLTGLQREVGGEFARAIRLISAVSGGSVGAMYFVNEYRDGNPPADAELPRIMQRAQESSLDKVAWGVVYPDLLRLITSSGFGWDRGQALERAWLRRHFTWDNRANIEVGLSQWQEDAKAGRRPGIILNTTVAETGQRLPLATVDLSPALEGEQTRRWFYRTLGGKDIRVVTATRLSAAFPYVSPAARADLSAHLPHVVDGAYYDNYGMASIVEWLDDQLSRPDNRIRRVLVVQIHAAPTPKSWMLDAVDETRVMEPQTLADNIKRRGWFFQIFAPIKALLGVREAAQLSHARVELRLLVERWRGNPGDARLASNPGPTPSGTRTVQIQPVVFEFCAKGDARYCQEPAPLSWHLNDRERSAIAQSWQEELTRDPAGSSLDIVKKFFGRGAQ